MSLGKVSNAGNMGKEFEGLTPEQIKEKIVAEFSKAYGRYENVSGKMWAEIYHNEGDQTEGQVIWRKGTGDEITEEKILNHPTAIIKFMDLVYKGYEVSFKGTTQEDMDKGNALRLETRSAPEREGWLGNYVLGDRFFRINEFTKGEYYIEYGYDGCATSSMLENESGARFELGMALSKGYKRESEVGLEFVNPLEAFGLELDSIEAEEEAERLANVKPEPVDGDLPDEFFELMK